MADTTQHQYSILWADDEIDLLKPHLLFLERKGYGVTTAMSGRDALDMCATRHFDLIILDENMPGLTGLETLAAIKQSQPHIPVIMITKSEEENIMNQAVGNKIADYLIKPVNPNQILIALKNTCTATDWSAKRLLPTIVTSSEGCLWPSMMLPEFPIGWNCTDGWCLGNGIGGYGDGYAFHARDADVRGQFGLQ